MSWYILDYYGYGFNRIGSLEEYFAYDPYEYYASLQMGLPALYYSGRENLDLQPQSSTESLHLLL